MEVYHTPRPDDEIRVPETFDEISVPKTFDKDGRTRDPNVPLDVIIGVRSKVENV